MSNQVNVRECPKCTGDMYPHSRNGYPATCRTCDYKVYSHDHYINAKNYYSIMTVSIKELAYIIENFDELGKENIIALLTYVKDLLK